MSKNIKTVIAVVVAAIIMTGGFLNSSWFNEQKESVYSELSAKYDTVNTGSASNEVVAQDAKKEENVVVQTEVDAKTEVKEVVKEDVKAKETPAKVENRTIVQIIWDYLIAHGYSKIQAAAIIGNLYQESGVNPSRVESNGVGIGLVQWSFGRRTQLEDYAKSKGKSWTDLETQLEFLDMELKGGKQLSGQYLQTFKNPYSVNEAVEAFCWGFERPNAQYANIAYRKQMAWKTYYDNVNR